MAESSNTDVKLTPQAKTLLCKEFPLNSRCNSTTTSAKPTVSPQQTTAPGNKATPVDAPITSEEQRTTSGSGVRNGTTSTGKNPPGNTNTTQPGSTTSPVGLPPSPGAQTRPYVTPQ